MPRYPAIPRFVLCLLFSTASVFIGQSLADEPGVLTPSPKHELADCMNRRMAANRTLSYNEASKACKLLLKSRKPDSASNNVPKPAS